MEGCRPKLLAGILILLTTWIVILGIYGVLKPISNGCIMTYMYPTYIPILASSSDASNKYGLYLYHEGWKTVGYSDHLNRLNGVPILFIPGNGGSYKQVRSLAAESERAFQRGVMERTFYKEGSLTLEEVYNQDIDKFQLPNRYSSRLDWFAVDLNDEHSAMDGQILEDHADYVVYAIHRVLDRYKASHEYREREGASVFGTLPKSVILVGHSMGGFVARAAVVHPNLRKGVVETIVTLASPHQSPPVALQPSLGHYFFRVNEEWRKGYKIQTSPMGNYHLDPPLSNVVVVSISGGFNDYQVRTNRESLKGIVPPTNGFMISSTSITNVWLSMEHQVILWCNQLVVRVSHSLLRLVDQRTSQPISDTGKRLAVFANMLRSGFPQHFPEIHPFYLPHMSAGNLSVEVEGSPGSSMDASSTCPSNIRWNNNGLEKDLYIQSTIFSVLAMDGRRRWLDIRKLGSNGKGHFVLVTNLSPCAGIRLHLWPERNESNEGFFSSKNVLEITTKLVQIPSGPPPRQSEPGSQTEQAAPSAVLWLSPENMHGFRFLTVSVAHQMTTSGGPSPAASMAVGHFFIPDDGTFKLSIQSILMSSYFHKEGLLLSKEHPLALNLSLSFPLGLFPLSVSLKTTGCGIEKAATEESENEDDNQLCKLLCFPPLALAWDSISGLHVFPNISSGTIVVDSSATKVSSQGSDETNALLLVDPRCSYVMTIAFSYTSVARRFFLLHGFQIVGLTVAVIFFALMRQARQWGIDGSTLSLLRAVECNLRSTLLSLLLLIGPIGISLFVTFLKSQTLPSFGIFTSICIICYVIANGVVLFLASFSLLAFYGAALTHVHVKSRWQDMETNIFLRFFVTFCSTFSSLKVIRIVAIQPVLVTSVTAITLGCFVDTTIGLLVLLLYHVLSCHSLLCSYIRDKKPFNSNEEDEKNKMSTKPEENPTSNSPTSAKSFRESQLDVFYHRHGLLVLHILGTLMFSPSLVARLQRIRSGHSIPRVLDSILCIGVIFHGTLSPKPEFNFHGLSRTKKVGIETLYLAAGFYCYFCALDLKPYKTFYPMAFMGFLLLASRIARIKTRENGESHLDRRKHSHRH